MSLRIVSAALFAFLLLCFSPPAAAAPAPLVRILTSEGAILIELDVKQAPITAGNFLRYAAEKRLDNTTFYRAARNRKNPKFGLVQGGINHGVVRARLPIPHEPTSKTGLRHVDGTVSMARNAPGTAMGDFFVTVGPAPYLDARPGSAGYAAFGKVVSGMPIIRKMLAAKTYPGGRSQNTMGQTIVAPIKILTVRRVR